MLQHFLLHGLDVGAAALVNLGPAAVEVERREGAHAGVDDGVPAVVLVHLTQRKTPHSRKGGITYGSFNNKKSAIDTIRVLVLASISFRRIYKRSSL